MNKSLCAFSLKQLGTSHDPLCSYCCVLVKVNLRSDVVCELQMKELRVKYKEHSSCSLIWAGKLSHSQFSFRLVCALRYCALSQKNKPSPYLNPSRSQYQHPVFLGSVTPLRKSKSTGC